MSRVHVKVQGRARDCVLELVDKHELFIWFGADFRVQGPAHQLAVFLGELFNRLGETSFTKITKRLTFVGGDLACVAWFHGAELLGETITF